MKKFLLMSFCLLATTAVAQELFPELANIGKGSSAIKSQDDQSVQFDSEAIIVKDTNENLSQESLITDISVEQADAMAMDSQAPSATTESPTTEQTTSADDDENADEKIQIYMAEADATIVPNNNFSYCFGTIKFSTTTKRPVQQLDVEITYGPYPNTYSIRNLTKNQEQSHKITLVGRVCEHILDMPEMTVKHCVIENMDEAQCIKKVEFIPLRGA